MKGSAGPVPLGSGMRGLGVVWQGFGGVRNGAAMVMRGMLLFGLSPGRLSPGGAG
jgi:hypothetical protein